jgi:hypothetical protein
MDYLCSMFNENSIQNSKIKFTTQPKNIMNYCLIYVVFIFINNEMKFKVLVIQYIVKMNLPMIYIYFILFSIIPALLFIINLLHQFYIKKCDNLNLKINNKMLSNYTSKLIKYLSKLFPNPLGVIDSTFMPSFSKYLKVYWLVPRLILNPG